MAKTGCFRSLYGRLGAESRGPRAGWVVRTPSLAREALMLPIFLGPVGRVPSWYEPHTHRHWWTKALWSPGHLPPIRPVPCVCQHLSSLSVKGLNFPLDSGNSCVPPGTGRCPQWHWKPWYKPGPVARSAGPGWWGGVGGTVTHSQKIVRETQVGLNHSLSPRIWQLQVSGAR